MKRQANLFKSWSLVSAIDTIRRALLEASPFPDGSSEVLEDIDGRLPADAGVGDGNTLLETAGTLGGHLLVSLVDVRLNHDADNGVLAGTKLIGNGFGDLGLVAVVLERVSVGAINHHDLGLALLGQSLARLLHILGIVVCAFGATTQDDETIRVASGLGDGGETLLGHTHKVVLGRSRTNGVDGDTKRAVGAVLEAHGEGKTRGELSVQLRLGSSCANCAERDEVGEELRRDGVEHFRGNWHALTSEVAEELPADAQTLVDLVALVNVGVVDQTFPADCGPGLLEVGAHDDAKVVAELVGELDQARAVLDGGFRIVEGARSAHNQETVILLLDDLDGFATTLEDCRVGFRGGWDFGCEDLRRNQRIVAEDCGYGLSVHASIAYDDVPVLWESCLL